MKLIKKIRNQLYLQFQSKLLKTFKHALNLTLNWLCNVATFENVHRRTIIFAFDDYSYGKIKESWPELNVINWRLTIMVT